MAERRATTRTPAAESAGKRRGASGPKCAATPAPKKEGPRPLDHDTIRLAAICALSKAFAGDRWYEGDTLTLPTPAEPPRNFHGQRVTNEVAFARALLSKVTGRDWTAPVLANGFHADAVLLTLMKLAMGARLDLPAGV